MFRFEAQARMWRYGLRGLVDLGGLAGATVKSMGFFWENGRIISIISDLIIKYNKDICIYIYICHTHIYIWYKWLSNKDIYIYVCHSISLSNQWPFQWENMGDVPCENMGKTMKTIYKWENHRSKFNGHDSGIDWLEVRIPFFRHIF